MADFSHISLLIDLDCEWWLPAPATFTDTATYFPKRSARLVHESIHYWQQLSHGYLLRLAEEDWHQLLEWESGGHASTGPIREKFKRPQGVHGFSASDLSECLARFWEVLYVGPDIVLRNAAAAARRASPTGEVPESLAKLAGLELPTAETVELAMKLSGRYSLPFAVVRRVVGLPDVLFVFPFLAHFALKTTQPVQFFDRFLTEASLRLVDAAKEIGISAWDSDLVVQLYALARRCCREIVETDGDEMLDAPSLHATTGLADNPAYVWPFQQLARLSVEAGPWALDDPAANIDASICLPAFEQARALLVARLTPPCLRFRDRQILALGELVRSSWLSSTPDEIDAAETAAQAVLDTHARWENFQDRLRQNTFRN